MRKLKRLVAHENMKKAGLSRVNKGYNSYFSRHWKEFLK